MRIGYPCINRTLSCRSNHTFRLASYSECRFIQTVEENLACLLCILKYNFQHGILFFRITSQLIPFASHPVCKVKWQKIFAKRLAEIGSFARRHDIRLDMHPDQFIIINPLDPAILRRSIAELEYHVSVLDLMGLDGSAKVEIHGGGTYGDKESSMRRFVKNYTSMHERLKQRLAVENDERSYSVRDCLRWHSETGIPVVLDNFHHILLGDETCFAGIIETIRKSWGSDDGLPIVHYSTQEPQASARRGSHASTLDGQDFNRFLTQTLPYDFDLMLEIKDKEVSARKALTIARDDPRLLKLRIPSEK